MLSSNNFLQKHSKIALGYFFIIAFLGVLLRLFSVYDLSFTYRFVVHTHSHIALLGWVYTAITTLIFKMYLSELNIKSKYQKNILGNSSNHHRNVSYISIYRICFIFYYFFYTIFNCFICICIHAV